MTFFSPIFGDKTQTYSNINWKLIFQTMLRYRNTCTRCYTKLSILVTTVHHQIFTIWIVYLKCDHAIDLAFRNVLWAWMNVKYLNFGFMRKTKMLWGIVFFSVTLTVKHVNRHSDLCKITNCTSIVPGIMSIRIRYI